MSAAVWLALDFCCPLICSLRLVLLFIVNPRSCSSLHLVGQGAARGLCALLLGSRAAAAADSPGNDATVQVFVAETLRNMTRDESSRATIVQQVRDFYISRLKYFACIY